MPSRAMLHRHVQSGTMLHRHVSSSASSGLGDRVVPDLHAQLPHFST